MTLSLFFSLITELFPLAMAAVHAVETSAPAGTTSPSKLAAAVSAIGDTVAAAPEVSKEFAATKAALASGDSAAVGAGAGHLVEIALSVSKAFGLFSKAGVVQSAKPLSEVVAESPGLPG